MDLDLNSGYLLKNMNIDINDLSFNNIALIKQYLESQEKKQVSNSI